MRSSRKRSPPRSSPKPDRLREPYPAPFLPSRLSGKTGDRKRDSGARGVHEVRGIRDAESIRAARSIIEIDT
jgi:hypothetical protein